MKRTELRIISRKSPLAMWQANYVKERLLDVHSDINIEIFGINTHADRFLDSSLASMGGKGMFVKELEQALLDGSADIAVHSMKDVTIDLPDKLSIPVILKREDPRDAFVSENYQRLDELPEGAGIGTSSLRRKSQLLAIRPDLNIEDIRGNLGTRLEKLRDGKHDALILAAAGIKRLGMNDIIGEYLEPERILSAVGQGALGLESRTDDERTLSLISPLNDQNTHVCVSAERSMSKKLYGSCQVPVAGLAMLNDSRLTLSGMVGRLDGSEIIKATIDGSPDQAESLGAKLGTQLLESGADEILRELIDAG